MQSKTRHPYLAIIVELALISLWVLWVGQAYLDFNPHVWPTTGGFDHVTGGEFGMVIRTHYIWTLLPRCGSCVLWNGFFNGGAPAFAEMQGAVLHPLVIMATLLWGGLNGTKVVLLGSLMMAGWAQWWLAKVLRLSKLPRLWSTAMVVVGAHLAGRMQNGMVGLVLSTAACSLVIAPALELALTGKRRAAILTGITLALALLSGQGYMQLGLLLGIFPALVVFLIGKSPQRRRIAKGFVLAGLLGGLLTAIFWIPLLHFIPNFAKYLSPTFTSVQPLEYLPLNLVIRDVAYYYSSALQHWPHPCLYANYIGWMPVLLGLLALCLIPHSHHGRRQVSFLCIALGLVYLCASAILFKILAWLIPDIITGVRYPSLISGLAVPLLLALAGWGLEQLLRRLSRRVPLAIRLPRSQKILRLQGLLLAPLLIWSLHSAYTFSSTWLTNLQMDTEVYQITTSLQSETARWIEMPFDEHFWAPPAIEAGLKLTNVFGPWYWKNREGPPPYLQYERVPEAGKGGNLMDMSSLYLHSHSQNEYAFVNTGTEQLACQATAMGGHIDVDCDTVVPGTLVVRENQWSGWRVRLDGDSVDFVPSDWLSVPAPAGQHHYTFRYRPWDVPLGLLVTLVGCVLAGWLWRQPVASISWLAALNRRTDLWLDAGYQALQALRRRWRRLQESLPSSQELRQFAFFVNGVAITSIVALFVIYQWTDLAVNSFIVHFFFALFILAVLASVILLTLRWHHAPEDEL